MPNTWTVNDDGLGDFTTVADAIAAASDGDTIIVTGGADNIQTESNIIVNKSLTIQGDGDATIDAAGASRVFTVDNGTSNIINVAIEELTITGGNTGNNLPPENPDNLGGGILNTENLTVTDSTITGNTAQATGRRFHEE